MKNDCPSQDILTTISGPKPWFPTILERICADGSISPALQGESKSGFPSTTETPVKKPVQLNWTDLNNIVREYQRTRQDAQSSCQVHLGLIQLWWLQKTDKALRP